MVVLAINRSRLDQSRTPLVLRRAVAVAVSTGSVLPDVGDCIGPVTPEASSHTPSRACYQPSVEFSDFPARLVTIRGQIFAGG
jgi:hypothetical protein